MPVYEYQCGKCGYVQEYQMKMEDPAPAECPECGYDKMKKLISQSTFHLKGTGWYVTDYPNKKKGKSIDSKL